MRRWVETWLARLTERIRKLIPETGWCISEWAICDFQWDGWWARKGDNRWGAGTAKGLNRDKIVKIDRLSGCKNFVGKRKKFIFDAFVDLKAVERFENESDMWGFGSLSNSTVQWPLMGRLSHLVGEEGPGQAATTPSPLLTVPNVTAHPSTASVPTS